MPAQEGPVRYFKPGEIAIPAGLSGNELVAAFIERSNAWISAGTSLQTPLGPGQLAELLGFARDGDTALVHSTDRLARNLYDLRALVQQLTRKGVRVEFVKDSWSSRGRTPMANLMLSVMGASAEFERSLIRERQCEGIALAKQRGA